MSQTQHTLFLWARGAFPRRIAYQLLQKGICRSAASLLAGVTTVPNLKINIATLTFHDSGAVSIDDADASDPRPQGKSSPALRVRTDHGQEMWIHESTSIALYIEEAFPDVKPALVGAHVLQRMQTVDMLTQMNLLVADSSYYIRHASPFAESWSGLPTADRSHDAARNALAKSNVGLVKLQGWCADVDGGFLTPGVEGPGVVDFALAAHVRYLWLCYEFDVLKDERLDGLRAWWPRFKAACAWWYDFEEGDDVHPPQLRFSKDVLEV